MEGVPIQPDPERGLKTSQPTDQRVDHHRVQNPTCKTVVASFFMQLSKFARFSML